MAQDNIEPKIDGSLRELEEYFSQLDAEGPTAAADESDLFDGREPTDEQIGQERDLWAESELAAFEKKYDAEQAAAARTNAPSLAESQPVVVQPAATASQQLAGRFAAGDQAAAPSQSRGRRM